MTTARSYRGVLLTVLSALLVGTGVPGSRLEASPQGRYEPAVELTGVRYIAPKKSRSGKKGGKPQVEFQYNLHPKVPTGARVEFDLQYQFRSIAKVLTPPAKGSARKGLKYVWTPEVQLPLGTNPDYVIMTSMPIKEQSSQVKKAIEKLTSVFPEADQPWPMAYPKVQIRIGSEEDLAREKALITKTFIDWTNQLLILNGEFADLTDAVNKGEKCVEDGDLDRKALAAEVKAWMEKMAKLQESIRTLRTKNPALFNKAPAATYLTEDLSKMVAKRATVTMLGEIAKKYKTTVENLRIEPVKGFDDGYQRGKFFNPTAMKLVYDQIAELANFPKPEEEEPAEEDSTEKDSDPPEKKPAKKNSRNR